MPCTGGFSSNYDTERAKRMSEEVDELCAMLCAVISKLVNDSKGQPDGEPLSHWLAQAALDADLDEGALIEWWVGHKREDLYRIKEALLDGVALSAIDRSVLVGLIEEAVGG